MIRLKEIKQAGGILAASRHNKRFIQREWGANWWQRCRGTGGLH
ncbi:hypothetical protein [uncultured Xylophilus sp.]|nr:hypothetical protein [uncultured Xylophilus sp.]